MIVLLSGVLGLLVGSFLNVVVWRVPRGESVVQPPSACPRCGSRIRPWDNVPVLSWLLLRGRCRDCAAPISVRYPLVEAGTGVAFALVAWWAPDLWILPAYLYLAAISVALALIDLDVQRLPDAIVLPSYPVMAALLALAAWSPGGVSHWSDLLRAMLAAACLVAFYGVVWLVYPRGMGLGDVKLAGVLGLALGFWGWGALVVGWFAAFLLGGVFSIGLMVIGRAGRRSKIPFGPWMIVGAWTGVVAGSGIASWYLELVGL